MLVCDTAGTPARNTSEVTRRRKPGVESGPTQRSPEKGMTKEQRFGGAWTAEKLEVVERYLDAFTTAMKPMKYRLEYTDAFAGAGLTECRRSIQDGHDDLFGEEEQRFLLGSALRAMRVTDRAFNRLEFNEQDPEHRAQLKGRLAGEPEAGRASTVGREANEWIQGTRKDDRTERGVAFLDPYGMSVSWETMEHIAKWWKRDLWVLFPIGTVARCLPRVRGENEPLSNQKAKLNSVYGGDEWRTLYETEMNADLFGNVRITQERERGTAGMLELYRRRLQGAFGNRLLPISRPLNNSRQATLYQLFFCCGDDSSRAIEVSHRIAGHLVKKGRDEV